MEGKEIGNWILERKVGEGGMGAVYLARHKTLGTPSAVKVLSSTFTNDPKFRDRFFQEAQTQAQLRHPNIAQVMDYVEQDGQFYLVIEYLDSGTLADVIDKAQGPIGIQRSLTWIKECLSALDFAHQKGIIHRDIKSSNIMLDAHGQAKVTDFGIAVVMGGRRMTSTGVSLGTPHYMSPEQIARPQLVDHRSDVYSMGIVLYELLTGTVPFDSDTDFAVRQAQVNEPPPPPSSLNANITDSLERIVLKALAKEPADRYSGCGEFIRMIEMFERGEEIPPLLVSQQSVPSHVSSATGTRRRATVRETLPPLLGREPADVIGQEITLSTPHARSKNLYLLLALGLVGISLCGAFAFFIFRPSKPNEHSVETKTPIIQPAVSAPKTDAVKRVTVPNPQEEQAKAALESANAAWEDLRKRYVRSQNATQFSEKYKMFQDKIASAQNYFDKGDFLECLNELQGFSDDAKTLMGDISASDVESRKMSQAQLELQKAEGAVNGARNAMPEGFSSPSLSTAENYLKQAQNSFAARSYLKVIAESGQAIQNAEAASADGREEQQKRDAAAQEAKKQQEETLRKQQEGLASYPVSHMHASGSIIGPTIDYDRLRCWGTLHIFSDHLKYEPTSSGDGRLDPFEITFDKIREVKKNKNSSGRFFAFHIDTTDGRKFNLAPDSGDPESVAAEIRRVCGCGVKK